MQCCTNRAPQNREVKRRVEKESHDSEHYCTMGQGSERRGEGVALTSLRPRACGSQGLEASPSHALCSAINIHGVPEPPPLGLLATCSRPSPCRARAAP